MWEDGFCQGRVSDCLEDIDGEDPVRKAFSKMSIQLYNYGEGWVLGRCLCCGFNLSLSLSLWSLLYWMYHHVEGNTGAILLSVFWLAWLVLFETGWWERLHLISATNGSSKSLQNVKQISPITGKALLMLYAFWTFKSNNISLWSFALSLFSLKKHRF